MHSFRVSDLNWRLLYILNAWISHERKQFNNNNKKKSMHDILFSILSNENKKQSNDFYLLIKLKCVHPFSIVLLRMTKSKNKQKTISSRVFRRNTIALWIFTVQEVTNHYIIIDTNTQSLTHAFLHTENIPESINPNSEADFFSHISLIYS